MTISTTTRTAGPFTGTGAIVACPFAFKTLLAADLAVTSISAAGVLSTLVLTTDYAVSLNADQDASPGGTVTPVVALALDATLSITTAAAATQGASLTNLGGFFPKVIEGALDRLTILIQQILSGASRLTGVLQYPVGDLASSAVPAAAGRASKLLGFDASGNVAVVAPSSQDASALALSLASNTLITNGAGQVGFKPTLNYVAQTIGAALNDGIGASLMWFVTDQTERAAIKAGTSSVDYASMLNSVMALYGRTVVPSGTWNISSLATIPANTVLEGAADGSAVLKQNGAAYAVKLSTGASLRNIKLVGSASALGAVDLSNCGWGDIEHCHLMQFNGTNANVFYVNESYRVRVSHCYIYDFYNAFKFAGNATAFEVTKCNIAVGHASGRAIDATGGTSIEAYFNTCYFESCYGPNPIYSNTFGRISFTECGFEACCVNSGYTGSIANPKLIQVANPTRVYVDHCQFSGFLTASQTYTGTLYFLYAGTDSPVVSITANQFTQNAALGALPFRVVGVAGKSTLLTLAENEINGTGYASLLAAEKSLLSGIDSLYSSRMFTSWGNRIAPSGYAATTHQNTAVLETAPPVGNSSTSNAVITGTGANYSAWSRATPAGSWRQGGGFKLVAWGRRIGVVNTKQAKLQLTANTATTWAMTAAVTAANDWKSEVVVLFRDSSNESIGITSTDGAALSTTSALGTKDSSTYDMTIEILLDCAGVGDSMTLDGMVLERF